MNAWRQNYTPAPIARAPRLRLRFVALLLIALALEWTAAIEVPAPEHARTASRACR